MLLAAFAVARGCASSEGDISKEQAIEIARREIDYRADRVQVRLLRRGFQSRSAWAVSLSALSPAGQIERVTVVVIDARTREVVEIRTGN